MGILRRYLFIFVFLSIFSPFCLFSLDFADVDKMIDNESQWNEGYQKLKGFLDSTLNDKEKAEVCWRLSRFCEVIGDTKKSKEEKRQWFTEGKEYAEFGIQSDSNSYKSYFWRSANYGMEVLTRSVFDQMSSVDAIWNDYVTIVDKLGVTDYAEVWHSIGEFYWRNPFKPTAQAVSYLRASLDARVKFDMMGYVVLAKVLYERNWTVKKRITEINKMKNSWNNLNSANSVRYGYYEGKGGSGASTKWSTVTLGEMSDRQEAKIILQYACLAYDLQKNHSYYDYSSYNEAKELLSKWK